MRALSVLAGLVVCAGGLLHAAPALAQDLVVSDLSITVSGSNVTYAATVCNNGSTTTTTFDLEIYYDLTGAPDCNTFMSQQWSIAGLQSGGCTTRTYTRTGVANGTYTGWARVDADCVLAETNENNNNLSKVYVVGGVDLVLSNLDVAVNGTTVTYSATICNQGAETSQSFYLDLYYDRTSAPTCSSVGNQFRTISGLQSGACTTETFTRTNAPAGSYTAWARVDAACAITEVDEVNNDATRAYTVGTQPDLVVDTFDLTVSGSTVTYTVTVCNQGASTSASFDVEVYYDLAAAPGCTSIASRESTVGGLASGACTTVTFTRTGAPNGVYTGWARVDADCTVTESNEGNNNVSKAYTVGGTDLVVDSFNVSVSGSTATYTITVCNQGTATSQSFYLDLYYDRTTAPTCSTTPNQWYTVSGLGTGACTTHSFTRTGTPDGSYTAWARVDGACVVNETDENNNNSSRTYTVGGPDLVVSSFAAAASGSDVTYTVTICNNGTATSQGFYLDLYYNRTTAPTCSTNPDDYQSISGLGAGACTTRTFTRTGAQNGTYTGWARVDGLCSVTESNENNNNASAVYTVGQPDLVVSSFSASVSNTTVTYTVTICNNGGGTSQSFYLDLYYDRTTPPTCSTTPDEYTAISGLGAGACTTETFTRSNAPNGTYTGWARVDGLCSVTESNENNNNASTPYSVGVLQQPDLVVSSLTTSVSGTTVTYTVMICNNGASTGTSFFLDLYYDRSTPPTCSTTPEQWQTISGLGAGACAVRTFTQSGAPAGSHTAWARVDGTCTVTESDEGNNNASSPYSIAGQPDLVVSSLNASVNGPAVTFTVSVCNNGGATSQSFQIGLYYDRSSVPTCSTAANQTLTVNGLAGGACTTQTFTRSNTPAGSYTAWALADFGCVVSEIDENNNTASAAYSVSAAQPDLVVSAFTATVTGNLVTFSATVCNNGAGDATASFDLEVFYNQAGAPDCTTTESQQSAINGLAAGACSTFTFSRAGTPNGAYTGWALADGDCVIAEANETNNASSAQYVVLFVPPDGGIDASLEAGPEPDIGVPEQGIVEDQGLWDQRPTADQGLPPDQGPMADQGTADQGPSVLDGAPSGDLPGPGDGGCDCRVEAGRGAGLPLGLLLLLGLFALRRRR